MHDWITDWREARTGNISLHSDMLSENGWCKKIKCFLRRESTRHDLPVPRYIRFDRNFFKLRVIEILKHSLYAENPDKVIEQINAAISEFQSLLKTHADSLDPVGDAWDVYRASMLEPLAAQVGGYNETEQKIEGENDVFDQGK